MIRSTVLSLALATAALQASVAFAQTPAPPAPYTPPAAAAPEAPAASPAPAAPADAPAAGPDEAAKSLETLAVEIEDVQVVAPWTEGQRSGVWRTVMMQVKGKDEVYRFFIQQLERTGAGQTILGTTEIKEIQTINGAVVGYRADEPTEGETNGLTLFFDIVPRDGEIAETYELHFTKDAPYVFGPATN
ncbi:MULTISPECIES: hypothetical protein [unclassified Aureimonas]|uniref:hypothetical protein n=1 Tax=unclassified Aureimonas TaxID=2615206 RepID=UPI0006F4DC12|nr:MULTISPECIES: hypothetical protein [unclassified Aureimonas]KQT60395.1 hypothetical protein ASG62_07005 [Aureimonas sp. Leaf427]KQT79273.1 hypothetical protein ASG54_09605 [Aureimonas sp. Leaf460]